MNWRILNSGKGGSAENMAVDEAIFLGLSQGKSLPTIRFYDWQPPTVSCGYNQIAEKEIDFEALRKCGYGFVRRPTGGRIVLHQQEVTYAVIAPVTAQLAGNVTDSYSEISRALAVGLRILGIEVELEKGSLSAAHQRREANPCFASSSRFELAFHGKKIVGSAQMRKNGFLLQHGSILLNFDQRNLAEVIPVANEKEKKELADFLSDNTIAINKILAKPISFEDAVFAFTKGFYQAWQSATFSAANELDLWERNEANRLISTKYLTDEWNKRK